MNKKISELSSAGSLTGTEVLPIVQSGVTVKATAQAIADLAGTSTTLQEVLTAGNTTNLGILLSDNNINDVTIDPYQVVVTDQGSGEYVQLLPNEIVFSNGNDPVNIVSQFQTAARTLNLPDNDGTIATYQNLAGFVLPTTIPSNPLTGSIYFDSGSAQLKVWNGSWVSIS